MSAPPAAGVDVRTALSRADRAWCKERVDEPLDVDRVAYLAAGLEQRLDAQACTHADVDQLREQIEALQRRAERAEHQRNTWKGERDRVVDELAKAHTEAERQRKLAEIPLDDEDFAELRRENERLRGECNGLTGLLEEAGTRIAEMQRQVEDVLARAEQLASEASTRPGHRHAWEVQPGLKYMPLPCSCGLPWPRGRPVDTQAVEKRRPRVELLKPPNGSTDPDTDTPHPEGQ